MIIGDMEIRLRADIARLQRDMDDARRVVGDATAAIGRAADMAKTALAGIASAAGLSKIAEMSDQYSKLTAQLRLATDGSRAYSQAYADVKRIANSAQADLAATGSLFASLLRATKELGVSQKGVADITEAVSLAFKISGSGAQETAGALIQLSQAFASGALRGDEFNSVNEAAPRLMQAIADSIGKPVGALRAMAAEGKLTAEVVATALPKALSQLQSEASQIQTISGAFTALKNNVVEFTGVQAQASGAVSVITSGINAFANNLGLVAGAIAVLAGGRFLNWLSDAAERTTSAISANRALVAANLAVAESNALEATQASLTANARLSEVRATTLAAEGNVQLALATNALIPAQIRAVALAEAQAASMAQLTVAQRAAGAGAAALAAGTSALNGALALTGGPLGLLITVLGGAALAWSYYGDKAAEANAKAKDSTEKTTREIVDGLTQQNNKLRERIELSKQSGMGDLAKQGGESVERLAKLRGEIVALQNSINAGTAGKNGSLHLIDLQYEYTDLANAIEKTANSQKELQASTDAEKLKDWLAKHTDYLNKAGKVAAAIAAARKELGSAYNDDIEKKIRASFNKEDLQKAVEASKAQAKLLAELSGLSGEFSQDWNLLSTAYAHGKISLEQLTKAQADLLAKQPAIQAAAETQAKVREESARFEKSYAEALAATSGILEKAVADAQAEAEQNEEAAKTYGLTKTQIEKLTLARLEDQLAQRASLGLTVDEIATLEKVIDAKKRTVAALNNMESIDAQKQVWESIERTAHDTFVSIFDSGKSAFDRLRDTLKNGLLELLYQMTVKQWIFNIGASVGMTGTGAVAQAAGVAGGGFGSAGGSLLGSAAGSLFGAGGLSGSLAAGAGWMTGATTLTGSLSAAGSLIGTGTAGGIMSGIGMGAGALGPLALGAAGLYSLAKGLDHSGTPHTGGASSADQYGNVSTVRAESLNFEKTAVSDATNQFTAGIASSVVSILNGTAAAFGKTAAYSASAAFADDSSKDGAWGGLVIKQAGQKVLNWQDTRTSRWAPKEFADGEEGQKQYLAEVSKSVRAQLDAIGLPGWAKGMLDQLGNAPALADLAKTVDTINATEKALAVMGERLVGFGNLSDDAVSALMSASGGIEALAANASAYYDAFYSDAEKTKVLSDQVADALQKAGVTMPATREAYREQVEAQLALGSAGAPAAAALLGVAGAINEIYPAATSATKSLQQIADERKPLQDQLDELLMTSAQLLAKQRDALDDSNKALFDQVQAAQKVRTAQDAAKTSLGDFITQMKSFATTAKGLNSSLVLGELSTLTPEQQYAEARRQFELTRQQAAAGDTTAQGNLQSIEQTFLQLSQKLNGGDAQYSSDLATVMRTNDELAQWAMQSVDVAQSSLDALNNSAATLTDISATLTAIANGVQYLPAALSGQDVTSYAQAFAAIDYSSIGTSNMTALVDEIKALRTSNEAMAAELKGLRADQQKQTGDLIQAGAASTQHAAETVVEGMHDAITGAAYAEANSTRPLK